jgi:chromosome segregation ATPase
MNHISELESRITTALDRIRQGVARLEQSAAVVPAPAAVAPAAAGSATDDALAVLRGQLSDEQTANAQLEERVRTLKERQNQQMAALAAETEKMRERVAAFDRDLQRLRQTNADLRAINGQLRDALAEGVAEPHLINKAMLAELEALRAVRTADAAEVDAVLAELQPLLEEAR